MWDMSHLAEYLTQNGLTQSEFAERVGITQSVVSRLARRRIKPHIDLAAAIERETRGAVPAVSWADPRPARPHQQKEPQ